MVLQTDWSFDDGWKKPPPQQQEKTGVLLWKKLLYMNKNNDIFEEFHVIWEKCSLYLIQNKMYKKEACQIAREVLGGSTTVQNNILQIICVVACPQSFLKHHFFLLSVFWNQ